MNSLGGKGEGMCVMSSQGEAEEEETVLLASGVAILSLAHPLPSL
jgi:hypothetical protein